MRRPITKPPEARERRNPAAFPCDDRRIYDYYIAGRQSAALAVGVRIGLFEFLAGKSRTTQEILDHYAYQTRPMRALLAALRAMGLLESHGDRFTLAEDAAEYLVPGKAAWLGGLIDLEVDHFLSPRALLDSLTTEEPSVYGGTDPWEAHEADPEKARAFTEAMHSVSARPAAGFAESVDLTGVQRLLDVGGGSGALSIALAEAWPRIRCTVWDLPVVCEIAKHFAERAGVSDRVTAVAGDMFKEPFPPGHDAILLSQIMHDWPPEKGARLLEKAYAALPEDGMILIHEKLVDEDGEGPLSNVLVHLDMVIWTEGQQFTEGELRALLAQAGFRDVARHATAGYWSAISGRR